MINILRAALLGIRLVRRAGRVMRAALTGSAHLFNPRVVVLICGNLVSTGGRTCSRRSAGDNLPTVPGVGHGQIETMQSSVHPRSRVRGWLF